jgi:hypothetical protein
MLSKVLLTLKFHDYIHHISTVVTLKATSASSDHLLVFLSRILTGLFLSTQGISCLQ